MTGLADRHTRHQELLAFGEESLRFAADDLRAVASGVRELKEVIRRDGEVETRDGTPVIEGPSDSLRGCMDSVITRVRDREWVEPHLADAAPVAEFAAPVDELTAALRAGGLRYAMTCVEPLRRMLDDLTGAPDVVAAQAASWHAIGIDLAQLAVFLQECLDRDVPRRDRLDVRSYLALMARNVEGLIGCAEIAEANAVITKAAGDLILLTRDIVRGVIGHLFATTIVWTFDTSTVVTRRVMAARLGIVVATSWRIHAYISALTTSIITLSRSLDG
ncbi:hypothetical protein [Paractinoplanes globisporus]|uniref:Uncharacterized protein n=1 Tax=Paractinoplanes globisporus TaxID=113565 RepID=A0ABW6WGB0_9ACTN|nr:hypothetical protein [Actinoplanes globisporus]